jgi:hypothetical protein
MCDAKEHLPGILTAKAARVRAGKGRAFLLTGDLDQFPDRVQGYGVFESAQISGVFPLCDS